jgi:vanillate O-demethylase ferredoxin subunit
MNATPLLEVRVAHKVQETAAICTFELRAHTDAALPPFSAGAHIDVHLPNGLIRQYSLCNDPQDAQRYLIGVLNDPQSRGGSQALHHQVREGDLLRISAPKNHFPLHATGACSLLLAGGIGVTPLLAMAETLTHAGADFTLHYGARSAQHMAFASRIAASHFADRVQFHFDDGAPAQRLDLRNTLAQPQSDDQLYVCGPRGYMDAVLEQARAQGWREDQLHYEFFSGQVVTHTGDAHFQVLIASSGQVIEVPASMSVTQALAAAGVEIMTACEQGVCGTCLTRVLSGTPDHRDSYLTPEERAANDQFMPCCSRAKTATLTLDL